MTIGTFGAIIILFFYFLFKWAFRLLFVVTLAKLGIAAKEKGVEAIKKKLGEGA